MEKDRKKKIIALLVIVFVTTLSVAFAAMSRTLNINGTAKMDTATWDVHFENLSDARIIRDAVEINKPYISDDGIMIYDMDVKLTKPKDEIIYTVEIVNSGTIDAEIESIEVPALTEEQEKLIDFTAVYNDGTSITEKDFLKAGESDLITISIKYSNDITEFDLPDVPLTINLTFKINYIQSDSLTNENSGKTEVKSVLAKSGYYNGATNAFFNGTTQRQSIESIDFLSTMYVPGDAIGSWDASYDKDGSVVAWYTDLDENGLYELNIGGNGKVYAPSDCSNLFKSFSKLKQINFNNNFDTSNIVNMSGMFLECLSLNTLVLSDFNTSAVTNMSHMFQGCNVENLDLSSFDTSNVTNMSSMFYKATNLKSLNMAGWDTSKVTNMLDMFASCISLTNIDLTKFNTSNVTNMSGMFYGIKINALDLSGFNTSKVTTFGEMFRAAAIGELNMSGWNTSSATSMYYMFMSANIPSLDLSSFDTSKVTNMVSMFSQTFSTTEIRFNKLDTTNVTDYWNIFFACAVKTLDISEVESSMYSNDAFKSIISTLASGKTIYVLNEECVTLGQAINPNVTFVVKEA